METNTQEPFLRRSENPIILGMVEEYFNKYSATQEQMDDITRVLARMDIGQLAHKEDYLSLDCVEETLQEIDDSAGWALMEGLKHVRSRKFIPAWLDKVAKFREEFKKFKDEIIPLPKGILVVEELRDRVLAEKTEISERT